MSELTSSLLVAMPQLDDPNFRRAVVLLKDDAVEEVLQITERLPLAANEPA